MAPRPISTTKFAEAVKDRLIDSYQAAEVLGYRNPQSVFDAVARGALPEPILKVERGYAFWDLLAILNTPTGQRRAVTNTEVTPA
jgi:hypothetical protein